MIDLKESWQAYNRYRIEKRVNDASVFVKADKDMKKMLVEQGRNKGANLLDSSFYTTWQAENTPRMEEPTFENFMNWLATND